MRLLGPLAGALGSLLLFDAAERIGEPGAPASGRSRRRNRRSRSRARNPPPLEGGAWGGVGRHKRATDPSPNPLPQGEGEFLALHHSSAATVNVHPGLTAAALLNATLMAGAGAVIMTPDTPLLFFWTCCLWALARLLDSGRPAWWLAIGVFAGLALASKYTALLLWIGIALWVLLVPSLRHWWRSPMLWAGALLGALVFLPVVLWNAAHGWVSFLRQGGRVDDWQPARAAQFLGELAGGQFGLATPLVFLLLLAGVGWATRRAWQDRDPACALLCALTLPGAMLFLQHAFGDRVQGNWPAILYPAASIAATGLHSRLWLRLRWPAVALGVAITLLVYLQATSFVLPFPPRLDPIARELAGWDGLARSVGRSAPSPGRRLRCRGRVWRRGRAGPRTARRCGRCSAWTRAGGCFACRRRR